MAVLIPIIAVAATVASTAYSIVSSNEAASEAHEQAKEAAGRAMATAGLEAQNAERIAGERRKDEEDRRRRILSAQRASYAASGLQMEGSPLLVQADTILASEENMARITLGQELTTNEAYRFGLEKAEQYRDIGNAALEAGTARSVQAGFQGATNLANQVNTMGKAYKWW